MSLYLLYEIAFVTTLRFFGTPKSSQTLPEALPGSPGALPEASTADPELPRAEEYHFYAEKNKTFR